MTLYRYCYAIQKLEVLRDGAWVDLNVQSSASVSAVLGVGLPLQWDEDIPQGMWDLSPIGTKDAGIDREMLTRYFVIEEP